MTELTYRTKDPHYKDNYGCNIFVLSNGSEVGAPEIFKAQHAAERVIRGEFIIREGLSVGYARTVERNQ